MGRKTDREILRENRWLTVLSAAFILCGIWIALLPHLLPFASYDSLQGTEATVQSFKHFYGGAKGLNVAYLLTTDNEKYILSGDYDHQEAAKQLTAEIRHPQMVSTETLWGAAGRGGVGGRKAHRPIRQ